MKKIIPIAMLVVFMMPFVTGCASMAAHCEGPRSDIYPGVRNDILYLTWDSEPVLTAIDLPFSFAWDTLMLPFLDGPAAAISGYESIPAVKARTQARIDRQGRLVDMKVSLTFADRQLHTFGVFTNRFEHITVGAYTNQFIIHGKYYQCELAAECEQLTNRGFLTITTNQVYVWIDTQGRQTPLGRQEGPAGF